MADNRIHAEFFSYRKNYEAHFHNHIPRKEIQVLYPSHSHNSERECHSFLSVVLHI